MREKMGTFIHQKTCNRKIKIILSRLITIFELFCEEGCNQCRKKAGGNGNYPFQN